MFRIIAGLDRAFVVVLGFLCVVLFAVMIVAIFGQVVMRYAFSSPLSWSEELARYSMVWLAMLSAALCSRLGQHISLTGFEFLSGRAALAFRVSATVFVCGVLAILLWHSWDLASRASRETTPGLGLSMSLIYACLPVGFALMIVGQLLGLATRPTGSAEGKLPPVAQPTDTAA